jgi:hypothetical protein
MEKRRLPIPIMVLAVCVLAPAVTLAVNLCISCGVFWFPDPTGGPSTYCESCFDDFGNALNCIDIWNPDQCSGSCMNINAGDCSF